MRKINSLQELCELPDGTLVVFKNLGNLFFGRVYTEDLGIFGEDDIYETLEDVEEDNACVTKDKHIKSAIIHCFDGYVSWGPDGCETTDQFWLVDDSFIQEVGYLS